MRLLRRHAVRVHVPVVQAAVHLPAAFHAAHGHQDDKTSQQDGAVTNVRGRSGALRAVCVAAQVRDRNGGMPEEGRGSDHVDQRGLPLLGGRHHGDHPADNVPLVRAPPAQVPPRQPGLQPGPGQPSSCQRHPPSRPRHFRVHGGHPGVGGGRVHPPPRQLPRPLFERRVRRGPVRGRLLRAAVL